MDFNQFLLDLYVVELAPVFSQNWFHDTIGNIGTSVYSFGLYESVQDWGTKRFFTWLFTNDTFNAD